MPLVFDVAVVFGLVLQLKDFPEGDPHNVETLHALDSSGRIAIVSSQVPFSALVVALRTLNFRREGLQGGG